ncbi:hypothetical protein [Gottschalkia purinilytica]|uniref:hypothetical protein n=1 Tax=Gottschalkia purinilytica TaxID=1503 RepID=UPI0012FEF84B|nr:hypothetical protein [Gottschalkia purinilytica]
MAISLHNDIPLYGGLIIAVLVGALCGLINGTIISFVKNKSLYSNNIYNVDF